MVRSDAVMSCVLLMTAVAAGSRMSNSGEGVQGWSGYDPAKLRTSVAGMVGIR